MNSCVLYGLVCRAEDPHPRPRSQNGRGEEGGPVVLTLRRSPKTCSEAAYEPFVIWLSTRLIVPFSNSTVSVPRVAGIEIAADHVLESTIRIVAEFDFDVRFAARFDFRRAGIADADVAEPIRNARDVDDDILQRLRAEVFHDDEEAVEWPQVQPGGREDAHADEQEEEEPTAASRSERHGDSVGGES